MAKTQTKTEIRNAAAKAEKLLRGIDNQTEQVRKDQKKLDARLEQIAKDSVQVRTLISNAIPAALNVAAQTAPSNNGSTAKSTNKTKPVAKAGGSIGTKKKTATPKKTTAKPKAQASSKTQKGQGSAKKPTGKAVKATTSSKDRRPLKEAINEVIAEAGPLLPAELYKQVTKREGYYSRQSLYMALKSNDYRKLTDGRVDRAASTKSNGKATSNDEADNFVASVDNNAAVAGVI